MGWVYTCTHSIYDLLYLKLYSDDLNVSLKVRSAICCKYELSLTAHLQETFLFRTWMTYFNEELFIWSEIEYSSDCRNTDVMLVVSFD